MSKIKDYYKLFDFTNDRHGIHYVTCKTCKSIIFNRYRTRNWSIIKSSELTNRLNSSIRYHVNNYHYGKEEDVALRNALHYLKTFPFRPYIQEKRLKMIRRVPLKPWKDPESLFCDTKFLREFLGKEPAKGKECKDNILMKR